MAFNVTVVGANGTVTIPFTTDQLGTIAQSAGSAISNLPASDQYFDPPGAVTTKAHGIVLYHAGANVVGTAANASVLGGGTLPGAGDHITYTAVGKNQGIYFSGDSIGGNLLKNGSHFGESYYIDAGGTSPTAPGTTVNATLGSATINAYSGYLDVIAGCAGVLLHDLGGNVIITGGYATVGGSGAVTMAGGNFDIVPYSANPKTTPPAVPSLTAAGKSDVITSAVGINVSLLGGAAVNIQGSAPPHTDTITALGSGSIYAGNVAVQVNQAAAGDLSIGGSGTGQTTVNTTANATETITYTNKTQPLLVDVATGDTLSLTGGNRFVLQGTGSDTIRLGGSTTVNLAGGNFSVGDAGAGARITFSGADTVSFASTALAASVLAAQNVTLKTDTGLVVTDSTTAAGKRLLITGSDNATTTYFIKPSGNNVLYFGTVSQTDWNGVPVASTGFTANNVVVTVSGGSQTVFGGGSASGGVLKAEYGGTSGKNLLVGAVSIFGGGSGDTLQAGAYTTYIQAASKGNDTLIGSDLTGAAPETLVGGVGADTFIFGTGNETLTGGKGNDQFVDINLHAQNTTITITDFVQGSDKIDLFSPANTTTATITGEHAYGTGSSGYTLVTLSDGVTIKFAGYGTDHSTISLTNDFVIKAGTIQPGTIA